MKVHIVTTEHYSDTHVMHTPQLVQYNGKVQTKLETIGGSSLAGSKTNDGQF